jgi:PKD repeat protein
MRAVRTYAVALLATGAISCVGEAGSEEELLSETKQAVSLESGVIASAVVSESQDLDGFPIVGFEPTTLSTLDLQVSAKAKWQGVISSTLEWDGDKVRQGQTLDVKRTGSSLGFFKMLWTISGTIKVLGFIPADVNFPIDFDLVNCAPPLDGSAFHCEATSPSFMLFDGFLPGTPYVKLAFGIEMSGTGAAATTTRTLYFGDQANPSGSLELTPDQLGDEHAMPCNKPAGTTVDYALDPFTWSPASVKAVQRPKLLIGFNPFPAVEIDFGPSVTTFPTFTLEGAGNVAPLGELLPNNVNPTVDTVGPFSGDEGEPVIFGAATSSACPITSYVWNFSDGTTSYGAHPQRAFGDDGQFDGQLTVTDMTALSGTGNFTVAIANRLPVAAAGPNTSGAWGTQIALNGQAVDPGTNDQATLVYTWDFGDGTPGAGGASVTHAYAQPGDYTATFKACDDHGCDTDTASVHVRKRTTSVGYTGANAGVFSAPTTLVGSLVDELGQPVVGGTVSFTLAGVGAGSAQTNAFGNAARTIDVNLVAGAYVVGAEYAGSSLYDGGNTVEVFDVSRMSTSVQYTGALQGGPNKTVTLSAKLVDGLGRGLGGKTIAFQLGTQSVSATTTATGIATASLKLNQHNGTYPLTATYAGDATQWTAGSASATFKIGNGN